MKLRTGILILLCSFYGLVWAFYIEKPRKKTSTGFKQQQLKYARVKEAYSQKQLLLDSLYRANSRTFKNAHIFIRVFKWDKTLELWARNAQDEQFSLIKSYPVCAISGKPGPKSKAGDLQIPEGVYEINRFNPASNYHLSLGISYPNKADRIRAGVYPTGGDIFIHGDCVTIGCVPLTDDLIKEVYIAAVQARESGQKNIRVEIYPYRFREDIFSGPMKSYATQPGIAELWKALNKSYLYFESHHHYPDFEISDEGNYNFTGN